MKKKKPAFKLYSYGEYTKWNRESKAIPKVIHFATEIVAEIGTEFGYVLHIKQGKGETVTFKIDHPPFADDNGKLRPPFTGEQFISTNNFEFYLGDCIWEPLEDKLGNWELTTYHNGIVVANKVFKLVAKTK
jgi:hypothetical protein